MRRMTSQHSPDDRRGKRRETEIRRDLSACAHRWAVAHLRREQKSSRTLPDCLRRPGQSTPVALASKKLASLISVKWALQCEKYSIFEAIRPTFQFGLAGNRISSCLPKKRQQNLFAHHTFSVMISVPHPTYPRFYPDPDTSAPACVSYQPPLLSHASCTTPSLPLSSLRGQASQHGGVAAST
jgi:hypothetical protein